MVFQKAKICCRTVKVCVPNKGCHKKRKCLQIGGSIEISKVFYKRSTNCKKFIGKIVCCAKLFKCRTKNGQNPSCKFQKEHCTNKITPVVRLPRKNCAVEYNGIINSFNGNKYLQDFTGNWVIFKNPSFEVHAKIKKSKKNKTK